MDNTIKYTEIFTSFQGEGYAMGSPAVFLRLYGCNLHCVFCDEIQKQTDKKDATITEIHDKLIKEFRKTPPNQKLLVITGGEPYLQYTHIKQLINRLHANYPNIEIHIETNGTVQKTLPVNAITISPKTTEKKQLDQCITFFSNEPAHTTFKFIVTSENMNYLIDYINNNPKLNNVLLQPETSNAQQITSEIIQQYPNIKQKFKLSTQTHKFLKQK